jgi:hypothetical protein
LCTQDYCDPYNGCHYERPECLCDDLNQCTVDSCDSNYGCINMSIDCDDNDEMTFDYCDASAGCLHEPVGQGY